MCRDNRCVENAIIDGNTGWDNTYGFVAGDSTYNNTVMGWFDITNRTAFDANATAYNAHADALLVAANEAADNVSIRVDDCFRL